jgi:hypothetical protein
LSLLSDFQSTVAKRLSDLRSPARLVLLSVLIMLTALLLYWLFNELLYYWLAKSYVDEISQAYDINKGFTKALVWASFAILVVFGGWIISFSKAKRLIGFAGIVALLVAHSIVLGMRDTHFSVDGRTEKCYVLLRDGIKILNHVGVDPDSGRECRQLTPKMVELYGAYKNGRRAQKIDSDSPAFFESASGESIVWYSKNDAGRIELFDLMGWNPQTGDELQPIDRRTIAEWKTQPRDIRKAPRRIDPDNYSFFDATSGRPQVWFWLADDGSYEFYDGPGYHQATGTPLKLVSNEDITAWRREADRRRQVIEAKRKADEEAAAAKRKADEDAAAAKKKADDDAAAAKKRADDQIEEQARQAEAELQKQQQTGDDCDRLAANPTDANRNRRFDGVRYDLLQTQLDQAIDACSKAARLWPNELRYQFQLGRAYQTRDWKKAAAIFGKLVKLEYPAAFDNLGCIYRDNYKNRAVAISYFQLGVKHNDADAMVDLADNVGSDTNTKLDLLKRASELGHEGAQRAFALELQNAQQAQAQAQIQQENNEKAAIIFGRILGGVLQHQ